jgi:RimJ/RimL family protein N-acetyltransferase
MHNYKALTQQVFQEGAYSIVPIRMGDRYDIMQWRNEQIHHLRQAEPLTAAEQDAYFENVVAILFDQDRPNQLLFSFLKGDKCIGYGGLVHINWIDKNAEISFIMDTSLEKDYFEFYWKAFLRLIEQVAFKELNLHKIFTFAYDLRPHLYEPIENSGFIKEAVLKKHCFFNGVHLDVIIHSKFNLNKP